MSITNLISNVKEILMSFIHNDLYYIDEEINDYDNLNGGINNLIINKRNKIINKYINIIIKNLKNKKFDDVEKTLIQLFNFIRDEYYKSTISNYQNFNDYKEQLITISENFRYILYNIERFKLNKSLEEVYPTYHKNFKSDLFKLNLSKSKSSSSSDFSSYISSVSDVNHNEYLKFFKTDIKLLKKYMTFLLKFIIDSKLKNYINTIIKTNALDNKFIVLYNKIYKSLEKNKDKNIIKILIKIKKLNITNSIQNFLKYIEKEKQKHISEFKNNILNYFYNMKLTKLKSISFI